MKVARTFLTEDGLFVVSLSDKEAHYCKVLMDDVFGVENFVADVIWNSTKSVTNTALISNAHTHLLLYSKNIDILKSNRLKFRLAVDESKFSNPDNDPRGDWAGDPFQVEGERPNQLYEITNPNTGKVHKPNKGNSWKNEKKVFDELLADNRIYFGKTGKAAPQRKRFLSEARERGRVTTTLWSDLPTTTNGTQHLKSLFGEKVFKNPKPEGLMERIIQLATAEGDIVLDYHLGSGTTITTAHKMRRKYIGIEQMDYINDISVPRLQMVINGDDTGAVSENQNWQGGGSFVYAELAKDNAAIVELVQAASRSKELLSIWEKIRGSHFISYKVNPHEMVANIAEFKELDLDDQKKILVSVLDKNQLYVNYSEIKDEDYNISEEDQILNLQFYGSSLDTV